MSLEVVAMSDVLILKLNAQYVRVSDPVGLLFLSYTSISSMVHIMSTENLCVVLELSSVDR